MTTQAAMSETPRVDAATIDVSEGEFRMVETLDAQGDYVRADFARQLEREINQARKIAWDWAQGVTDTETAIRHLNRMFPIDGQPTKSAA